jgi:hypothetical protein
MDPPKWHHSFAFEVPTYTLGDDHGGVLFKDTPSAAKSEIETNFTKLIKKCVIMFDRPDRSEINKRGILPGGRGTASEAPVTRKSPITPP